MAETGNWSEYHITEAGRALRQTCIAEKQTPVFTRAVIGTGKPSDPSLIDRMSGPVAYAKDVIIKKSYAIEANHLCIVRVDNSGYVQDILATEVAVYARRADQTDAQAILYGYAYNIDGYVKIPAQTSATNRKIYEITLDTYLSRATDIKITYDASSLFVSHADLDELIEALRASQVKYGKYDLQNVDDALDHVIEVTGSLNENKANSASPALTGTPTAPTAAQTINNTQIATTAYVQAGLASKANNSEVVKLSGSQTIAGYKTLESNTTFQSSIIQSSNLDLGINFSNSANEVLFSIIGQRAANALIVAVNKPSYAAFQFSSTRFAPSLDNAIDLGAAATSTVGRWKNIYGATGTINTSDKRQKDGISTLDKIKSFFMALNPVKFRFKDGTSGRLHHGLVAQEVEEAMIANGITDMDFAGFIKSPDEENKDEYIYGLRYSEFIPMIIKMVQDQQKLLDAQHKEIEVMNATIGELKQRVTALENAHGE